MKNYILGSVLACLFLNLNIQEVLGAEFNFKSYQVEDGLSSNTVFSLIQDSKGYIWIGTEDGLNRFDGYEFKIFRNISRDENSILSNHIHALFEDSQKQLWIGTEKGVCLYNIKTNKFIPFDIKTSNGTIITGRIFNILSDKKGDIWISAFGQGVFRFNKTEGKLFLYSFKDYLLPNNLTSNVICVFKDKDDDLWVSVNNTKHFIYRLDKYKDKFVVAFPNMDFNMLRTMSFYGITQDSFGTLWIGSWDSGLFAVDKKNGTVSQFMQDAKKEDILHIHSIMEVEPGRLLIGSDGGLTSFSTNKTVRDFQKQIQIREEALSNRFIYPIVKDREGGLWIGTYYGGINYSSPNRNTFKSFVHDPDKNSLSGNVLSTICEDKSGNLWIATDDAGLNYYNTKTEVFTKFKTGGQNISFHNIHGLCEDNDDLWIGTYTGGLNVMNTKTGKVRLYKTSSSDSTTIDGNSIYAIFKDSNGDIWLGTMWGINMYNRKEDNFRRLKTVNTTIVDIIQKGNILFFATLGKGLYSYNLLTGKWQHYFFEANNNSSLISNDVSCLCTDESNILWIGTNNGICTFDEKTGKFSQIKVEFPSNNISYMTFVDGNLWITTTKGLVFYEPDKEKYRLFTKEDGLLSEQFTIMSGLNSSSGTIYIGTAVGLNAFNPKLIESNPYIPQIEITDFQILNKSVSINDFSVQNPDGSITVTLPYNKNGFSIIFSALSYFAPEKNEYAYIMDGFEDGWNYVGNQRKATYTNLPPGKYIFKVKGSNNDGLWNNEGLSIKIVITPPLLLSNFFMVIYVLSFLFAVYLIFKSVRRKQEKKQNEKIEKIKSEQEREVYNAKINFFTSIAHEIRTPVSLIIGPLEKIIELGSKLPEKINGDLSIIERNAQRLLFLVNQLLDFRKIEREPIMINLSEQNVNTLLMNIYDEFRPYMEHRKINFEYKTDDKTFIAKIDVENLTKVVSNLLNNTSKYSRDYVELALFSKTIIGQFEIRVTDNGCGIDPLEHENIFKPFYQIPGEKKPGTGIGLYLVKTIVDAFNGSVKVDSQVDNGTAISVFIPIISQETTLNTDSGEPAVTKNSGELLESAEENDDSEKVSIKTDKPVILILEDNVDMQEFLWKNFSDDYIIFMGGDGKEGIEILEKNEVDLIISDIMMPNMDGIEFCKQIKASFLWNHLPLVLLTAKTNLTSKIEAMETGADAYVEKPFSMTFLAAQVKNLLDSRKALQSKFADTPFMTLKSMAGNKADEEFLLNVNEIIDRNISNMDFSVENLSDELCVSSSGLYAKIKTLSGITPNKLLLLVRLKKAAELLCLHEYRVSEVCYMVGFNNPSYFAKCFYKQFGVLPKDFKCGQS